MEIPRFWAREDGQASTPDGRSIVYHCWRWSNESLEAARAEARGVAARMRDRIASGEPLPEKYAYGSRPLREERLRDVTGRGDTLAAVLTRNSYGSVVMNTAGALFVDSDRETAAFPALRRLFGKKSSDSAIEKAERVVATDPHLGFRVYETRAGTRYLATQGLFDPRSDETTRLMERLDVDPSYLHLCRIQGTFRARLTPKHWRIRLSKPPAAFPYPSPAAEAGMRDWVREYDAASEQRATCKFVGAVGNPTVHAELAPLIRLHDELTRSESGLALA